MKNTAFLNCVAGITGAWLAMIAGNVVAAEVNLALVATPSTSFVSGHETLSAVNDGFDPRNSDDKRHGAYGNWPNSGTQWVQYDWPRPISADKMAVYWFDDRRGVRLPKACRLKYWDGTAFVSVTNATGLGLAENRYNATIFPEIATSRLRLEIDSDGRASTGILEWKVFDSGKSPDFPPIVDAGKDRVVMVGGKTYLNGTLKGDPAATKVTWQKESGPGQVTFADANGLVGATFGAPGRYVLKLSAGEGDLSASSSLNVVVEARPTSAPLQGIHTRKFAIDNPLWNQRAKALIVNWVPHCIAKIEDPNLREGGLNNLADAAKKLAGQPHERHRGYVFANAWVFNTVEAICVALMVDPQGDQEIVKAQEAMKKTLEDWIPRILAAQEPDGYFQTAYTISGRERWSRKGDHEGYVAGYFLEAAAAHHLATDGKDLRLYQAARKLADCWYDHLGPPPKKYWYDGHQAMEMGLARFGRFVNEVEGAGKGQRFLELAKFLLDSRKDGEEYDQSHLPVVQQYEAVGHAVRASYSYAGMADIMLETGDIDYQSAVKSLWDNLVNRKYYLTGGIGSGETSEGFGPDYSLRNNAYCESCSSCGEIHFQHKLNLIYHDARYADLYEETLYNALLGSIDLEGRTFYYQNPLDTRGARYPWHGCPCCVGNIPRTLLILPTWTYVKDADNIYVNLFIGSRMTVGGVAGTDVELIQTTDYPWSGKVSLTVNPVAEKAFAVRIRTPNRAVSELYAASPEANGIAALSINGTDIKPLIENGYAVLERTWKAGDRIEFELPLKVQRIRTDAKVAANIGRAALRYGPLIYCLESADQEVDSILSPAESLTTEWRPNLLQGVVVIKGTFADGAPMTAVPYYARNNRGGRSIVWIKEK